MATRLSETLLYSFSALQRAENSSIRELHRLLHRRKRFQCSSASRKFLNTTPGANARYLISVSVLFSEPKIPQRDGRGRGRLGTGTFQCSSASRKFLNFVGDDVVNVFYFRRFSALQRAENSSRFSILSAGASSVSFSALQRAENSSTRFLDTFPKKTALAFQCSSASRKFLKLTAAAPICRSAPSFSALQRAENSSK